MAVRNEKAWKSTSEEECVRAFMKRVIRGVDYIVPEVNQFVSQDGEMAIRLVPPLSDDEMADALGADLYAHFVEGQGYAICPKTFSRVEDCPICNEMVKLRSHDPEAARSYKPSKRVLIWLLDYSRGADGELKVWSAPITLIEKFIRAAKNRRTGALASLQDPNDGRIIYFERIAKGAGYSDYDNVQIDQEPMPLDNSLLGQLHYFVDILVRKSHDELESMVAQALLTRQEKNENREPNSLEDKTSKPKEGVYENIDLDEDVDSVDRGKIGKGIEERRSPSSPGTDTLEVARKRIEEMKKRLAGK